MPLACAGLLIACSGGTNGTAHSAADSDTLRSSLLAASRISRADAFGGDHRQKHYTKDELDAAKVHFNDHFKVLSGGANMDIEDAVTRIPWSSIKDVEREVGTTEQPVQGIWIGYGLDGTRFHPILKFMYPASGGNLDTIPGACYSFDPGSQKLVVEKDAKKFTDAYLNDIRVRRTDAEFSSLSETGEADPLATWFPYADNVNRLVSENPNSDQVLVVSCISEELNYRELLSLTGTPDEFRHLITLHIGDGAQDDLTNSIDMAKPYSGTALDLGRMCPPNCPKP